MGRLVTEDVTFELILEEDEGYVRQKREGAQTSLGGVKICRITGEWLVND